MANTVYQTDFDLSLVTLEAVRIRLEELYHERGQKEDALAVEHRKHQEIVDEITKDINMLTSLIDTFDVLLRKKIELLEQDK